MSSPPKPDTAALRAAILARPQDILDDRDMMRALIDGNERRMGSNIVDLRGIAMDRLEKRLDRLEDTHRSVIAAAYENLAGTNQINRAVLRLLDANDLGSLLDALRGDVADILRVDAIRLVLEASGEPLTTAEKHGVLCTMTPGFIRGYLTQGGPGRPRDVTLREAPANAWRLYGDADNRIGSEACIRLDLQEPEIAGLLVLGARDTSLFTPQQASDLLVFFGGVVERMLRRWLK